MADADRLQLSTIKESVYGTYINAGQQILRYTSESLAATNENTPSEEIRGDRQIADVPRTSFSAGGDINFALSYGSYDNEFAYALQHSDTWVAGDADQGGDTIDAAAGDNSFNDSGAGFTAAVGDYIRVSGYVNGANNGVFLVTASTTAKLTVAGKTLVTEGVGPVAVIDQLDLITNGTAFESVCFQKGYTDLSTIYSNFSGMAYDSLSISIPTSGMVTGSFTLIGKDEVSSATVGTGLVAATTTKIFNAVDDVDAILENDAAYSATECSFTIQNNLRTRLQIGSLGPISVGSGVINVTGTLRAYFDSVATYDKMLNQTSTSLAPMISDALGNCYVFEFPEVKFTGGSRVAQGQNQDIIADLEWAAFMDPTLLYTVRIHKHAA
jgi:hypothetical protein